MNPEKRVPRYRKRLVYMGIGLTAFLSGSVIDHHDGNPDEQSTFVSVLKVGGIFTAWGGGLIGDKKTSRGKEREYDSGKPITFPRHEDSFNVHALMSRLEELENETEKDPNIDGEVVRYYLPRTLKSTEYVTRSSSGHRVSSFQADLGEAINVLYLARKHNIDRRHVDNEIFMLAHFLDVAVPIEPDSSKPVDINNPADWYTFMSSVATPEISNSIYET